MKAIDRKTERISIYYFTGTGNSSNVAVWISEIAAEYGVDCRLINIAAIDRINIAKPDPEALIIFISPVHGFNYPPVMLHFIARFPKGRNRVVLMNTRAGLLIGKFVTPGATGIAFYLSSLFLKLKGYGIRAFFPVNLPSNWISVHPGLNSRTVNYIHKNERKRVRKFTHRILGGSSDFRALLEFYDILLLPIAILYYLVGRFMIAKTYYASSACNNCGLCIKDCPVKAIIRVDNRPFWTFRCESCMRCMGNCPKKAIEVGHGFIIGFVMIFSALLLGLFYKYFGLCFFEIRNETVKSILEPLIFLILLGAWYRVVHYLNRYRLFERVAVFTSLTKYKFWGRRYKALKPESIEEVDD